MFDNAAAADPWIYYKMMHVDRVKASLALSYELGLYALLRDRPQSVAEVASAIGLHKRPAQVLLAANACVGVLGVDNGRYYIKDPLLSFATPDGLGLSHAESMLHCDEEYYRRLKESFLNNRPDPNKIPAWLSDPEGEHGAQVFDTKRDGFRMMWGMALAESFDFSPYKVVADLGGATGGVLSGLTSRCKHVRGVLVELPYSRKGAEACIKDAGASDRVVFYAADFFKDPLPDEADVMFMSHVLHDWDDEHCLAILRRCYEALPKGHPVIAQEFLLNDSKTGSYLAVFQWVGLVNWTMGDQRTAAEIADLMARAGFRNMESRAVDSELSIVVGWKA